MKKRKISIRVKMGKAYLMGDQVQSSGNLYPQNNSSPKHIGRETK